VNWTRIGHRPRTGGVTHILQSLAHGRSHAVGDQTFAPSGLVVRVNHDDGPLWHYRGSQPVSSPHRARPRSKVAHERCLRHEAAEFGEENVRQAKRMLQPIRRMFPQSARASSARCCYLDLEKRDGLFRRACSSSMSLND
jgi:hypothetical protein